MVGLQLSIFDHSLELFGNGDLDWIVLFLEKERERERVVFSEKSKKQKRNQE